MTRRAGFTLVELLVVIAIIAILASIVVPNVAGFIGRGKMAKAVSEINSIEMSFSAMLADAERSDFRHFFVANQAGVVWPQIADPYAHPNNPQAAAVAVQAAVQIYTQTAYALLRAGRNIIDSDLEANIQIGGNNAGNFRVALDRNVLNRIAADGYLDIGQDPWDNRYQFYMTKFRPQGMVPMPFRSWLAPTDVNDDGLYGYGDYNPENPFRSATNLSNAEVRFWTPDERGREDLPGAPPPDNLPGKPAAEKTPYYIWSKGENLRSDQLMGDPAAGFVSDDFFMGGGDDINNWDSETRWQSHYSD